MALSHVDIFGIWPGCRWPAAKRIIGHCPKYVDQNNIINSTFGFRASWAEGDIGGRFMKPEG